MLLALWQGYVVVFHPPSYILPAPTDIWGTGFGGWDAANLKYRLLPRPNDVPRVGDFFHQALPATIRDQRALAVGFGRGNTRETAFSLENPVAGAAIFLKVFPEARVASRSDRENIEATKASVARRLPH